MRTLGGTNTLGTAIGARIGPNISGPLAKLDVDSNAIPNTPANAAAVNRRLNRFIQ